MRFNILIVTNNVPRDRIDDDLELFREYVESRTPLRLNFNFLKTTFPDLAHESFGVFNMPNGPTELYGLKDAKDRLRPMTPMFLNHACIFIYRLGNTSKTVTPWTTYNELHPGTEFVEIPFKDSWDRKGELFRWLTHEIFHVWHRRTFKAGVWTADTMDRYDEENDPYSATGNRARNLAELTPHWPRIAAQPLAWLALRAVVRRLQANPSHMPQPLLKPVVGPISQAFGVRNSAYKSGIHNGTDYAVKVGTEVLAPAVGAITQTWANNPTMGNACTFEFSFEGQLYTMRILHLRKAPTKGIYQRGQVIAYTGNTGKTTGPHCHLEIFKGKYRPEFLLSEKSVRENLVDPEVLFA